MGRPAVVNPVGRLIPGMPALLPGSVLRMNVGKVGTRSPFRSIVTSSPTGRADTGEVGKITASTSCPAKYDA